MIMAALETRVKQECEDRDSADAEAGRGVTWEVVGRSHVIPLSLEESSWKLKSTPVKTEVSPTSTSNTCIKSEPTSSEEFSNNESCTCGLPSQFSDSASSHQHSDSLSSEPEQVKLEPIDLEFDYEGPSAAYNENRLTPNSAFLTDVHKTNPGNKIYSGSTSEQDDAYLDVEVDVAGVDSSERDDPDEGSTWLKISDVRSGEEQVQAMLTQDSHSTRKTSRGSRKRTSSAPHDSQAKRRKARLTVREIKVVSRGKTQRGTHHKKSSKGKACPEKKTKKKTKEELLKAAAVRENLMIAVASASASLLVSESTVTKVSSSSEVSDLDSCTISQDSKSIGFVYPHCSCNYKISAESAPGGEAKLKHVAIVHFMNKRLFTFIQKGEPYMSLLELKEVGLLPGQTYVFHTLPKLNSGELKQASNMEMRLLRRVYPDVAPEPSSTTMITPFALNLVYREAVRRDHSLIKTYASHMKSMFYLQRYNHKCPWTLLITPTSDESTLPALEDFQVDCPRTRVPHKPLILAARRKTCTSQPNPQNMKSSATQALIAVIKQFGDSHMEPYCMCETTTADLTWCKRISSSGVLHQVGRLLFLDAKWIYCWIRPNGIFVSVQELKVLGLLPWKKPLVEDMLLGGVDVKDRTVLFSVEVNLLKPFASSMAGELNTCLINVKFLRLIYRCLAKFEKKWIPYVKSKFLLRLREHRCPARFVKPNISKYQQLEQQDSPEVRAHVTVGQKKHDPRWTVIKIPAAVPRNCKAVQTATTLSRSASKTEFVEATATDSGSQPIAETSKSEALNVYHAAIDCTEDTAEDEVLTQSTLVAETETSSDQEDCGKGVDIQRCAQSCQSPGEIGRRPVQTGSSCVGSVGDNGGSRDDGFSAGGGLVLRVSSDCQMQTAGKAANMAVGAKHAKLVYMGKLVMKDGKVQFEKNKGSAAVLQGAVLEPTPKSHPNMEKNADKPSGSVIIVGSDLEAGLAVTNSLDQMAGSRSFRTEDYPCACSCQPPPSPFDRFSFRQCTTCHKNENLIVNRDVGLAVLLPEELNMMVFTFWKHSKYYFSVAELLNKEYFPASMDFSEIPQFGPSFWFLEADDLDLKFLKHHTNLKMSRFCRNLISAELLCHLTTMKGTKTKRLTQAGICLLQIGHVCSDTISMLYTTGKPPDSVTEAWRQNASKPVVQPRKMSVDVIESILERNGCLSTGQGDQGSTTSQEEESGNPDSVTDSSASGSSSAVAVSCSTVLLDGKEFGIAVRVLEAPANTSESASLKPVKPAQSDFFMYNPQLSISSPENKYTLSHLISCIGKSFVLGKLGSQSSEEPSEMVKNGEYLEKLQSELMFEGKFVTKGAAASGLRDSSPVSVIVTGEPEEVDSDYITSSLGAEAAKYWVVLTGSVQFRKQNHSFVAMKLEDEIYISWNALAYAVGNADILFQLGRVLSAHIFFPPVALRVHLSHKNTRAFQYFETPWVSIRELRAMYWLAFYNGDELFFPKTFAKLRKFVVDEVPTSKFQDFVLIRKTNGSCVQIGQ